MVPPRIKLILCAPIFATLTLAAVPASASAPNDDSAATSSSRRVESPQQTYKKTAVLATNAARVHHELRALSTDQCLQRFAARQAAAMARQESMYHQELGPIMRGCGVNMVGENVAYGFTSGREVVQGWMNSPGHRANILNDGYRVVAVAARESASGRWYAAQVFGRR